MKKYLIRAFNSLVFLAFNILQLMAWPLTTAIYIATGKDRIAERLGYLQGKCYL